MAVLWLGMVLFVVLAISIFKVEIAAMKVLVDNFIQHAMLTFNLPSPSAPIVSQNTISALKPDTCKCDNYTAKNCQQWS